ncbi:hypothetical protein AKJ09_03135 [Labilithrix luteola]|uniref:Desulfoferrodoxin ferrous iron-binding domain-containing protein n=1 Tax=Labilithrix luteola TaxID=1391654 RepID=A0A0K1PSW9_9BACT|nr:desulfoferrodoxin family protein [Labilithrix luteola]AKU96471.1 hypothetical protein AKJ09_03135 [Labilithrix luteola]
MSKKIDRRLALRALVFGTGAVAFGRVVAACSDASTSDRIAGPGGESTSNSSKPSTPPTDGDEYVPGSSPPVDTGNAPPTLPNQSWEARARQLEDDQKRLSGPVFSAAAPGRWAGKERSHVPEVKFGTSGSYKRATVVIQHVMGANGLDAGTPDAAADAAMDAAKPDAAGDAADAGDAGDAGDGGDAGAEAGAAQVHYITTIYLRAAVDGKDTVVGLWEFASTDAAPPTVNFTLPAGVTTVTAYESCTLHGLWKTEALTVT